MTVPVLPAQGATSWYPWAQGVDAAARGALSVSDAAEMIRDTIAAALVAGPNITITPNDAGDSITITAAGGGSGSSYTDEQAQDAFAALLAAGTHAGVSFSYNDAGNALSATVSLTKGAVGLGNVDNTADFAKPVSTAQQAAIDTVAASIPEAARDALGAALVAGTGITITPNDAADTITVTATGAATYSDEQAQDAFAALIAAGTHSGISFSYNDAGNALSATVTAGSVADATVSVKGAIQLAGDLGGTASSPTVPGLANKANASALGAHTGDTNNPHATTKAQVGLGNVDNTSDAGKPVSTATLAAFNARLVGWATNPDALFVGTITRDPGSGAPTSSAVAWPDGTPGTYTGTVGSSGGVDTYTVTYGSPATKTYTQPTVTRNANGDVTARPAITVA